jgi:hypothetical protein
MIFNRHYYDDIWGTVHRHDYCENLANQLISKYHPKSLLDIGTGCGYLVKVLRDKGVDAWGLEISEYAVKYSHGYVLKGDVRNIPFKDRLFDVVHSQGLWEYIPEEDINTAYKECLRVGRAQVHNIDTTADTGEHSKDFVTHKPQKWWDGKLQPPKILVACPNHEIKEYAFQRWIDNVKGLTYPNYDIFVSDNSPNDDFMNRWKDQVPIERIDTTNMNHLMVKRLNYSYEAIRQKFLASNYDYLMVIESDVIPPSNIIELLLQRGQDGDWISHAYPTRDGNGLEDAIQGLGCSLLSRRLIEGYDFVSFEDNYTSDGGLWMRVRPDRSMKTIELWNIIKNEHLGDKS